MNEGKESPMTKIFIQVAGVILTAVILYFIGINASGEKVKTLEKETQQQPVQPNLIVTNEIKIDNKNQNNNTGNQTAPISDNIISSPEHLEEHEPKIEAESKVRYSSEVKDENGKGIADVEIYCPNCIVKKVKTDKEGNFYLEGNFDKNAAFWQSSLILSKGKKSKTETIDWRENSPQPINL